MKLQLIFLFVCMAGVASAQNFFGNTAPKPQAKPNVISLPDKPNVTDAQGRKQGEWAKKYPNGRYIYEATFVDDEPRGVMRRYYENGRESVVLSYLAKGKYMAQLFGETGKIEAEGVFVDNRRSGQWKLYADNGKLIGTDWYVNGTLEGESKTYYDTGEVLTEVTYKAGEKDGAEVEYYRSGRKKRLTMFIGGKQHGDYRFWDEAGRTLVEGRFDMDVSVGDWKIFDGDTEQYYVMKYNDRGTLLNADEVEERKRKEMVANEIKRVTLQDPEHYMNRPEEYRP